MDVEIRIDKTISSPKIVIVTNEITDYISELASRLSTDKNKIIIGFNEQEIVLLNKSDIFRFYTEEQKIFARTENSIIRIKNRLYELDELLAGESFVRIANSEIANFDKVQSLDMSISGTIYLKFKNGDKTYVSRRYVDKIKKFLNL